MECTCRQAKKVELTAAHESLPGPSKGTVGGAVAGGGGGGGGGLINLHLGDSFPKRGCPALLGYMQHLPFIDSMMLGEIFQHVQ